jgi:hypothetical protein
MNPSIFTLLQKRYPSKEYALMEEVRDKAGFEASRSADYIAVNLWPSRGLAINGIELKSHRGDWLRELKKPEKADKILKYCDFFWLLTADDTVANIEEIPDNWGWLTVKGSRIVVNKAAPKLHPEALTKGFVCAMLKRAYNKDGYIRTDAIEDRLESARESGEKRNGYKLISVTEERDKLKAILQTFKEESGIDLFRTRWATEADTKKVGETVKFISNGGVDSIKKQLLGLEDTAKIVLERISSGLEAIQ